MSVNKRAQCSVECAFLVGECASACQRVPVTGGGQRSCRAPWLTHPSSGQPFVARPLPPPSHLSMPTISISAHFSISPLYSAREDDDKGDKDDDVVLPMATNVTNVSSSEWHLVSHSLSDILTARCWPIYRERAREGIHVMSRSLGKDNQCLPVFVSLWRCLVHRSGRFTLADKGTRTLWESKGQPTQRLVSLRTMKKKKKSVHAQELNAH